jgi:hypothetical protein
MYIEILIAKIYEEKEEKEEGENIAARRGWKRLL